MLRPFLFFVLIGFFIIIFEPRVFAEQEEVFFELDADISKGKKALNHGYLNEALEHFKKALNKKDLSPLGKITVHNDLCVTYMYLGNFSEAISQCEQVLFLRPNRWQTLNNLGIVYLQKGNYKKAIAIFVEGLEGYPNSRILNYNLEIALKRAGIKRTDFFSRPSENTQDKNLADFSFAS